MKNSELPKPKKYSQVIPDLEDWPLVKLNRDRETFLAEVEVKSEEKIKSLVNGNLEDVIARTLFEETLRIREQRWSTDPEDDESFWKSVKEKLLTFSDTSDNKKESEKLLGDIIARYTREIAGKFSISGYLLAQRVLNVLFYPLLNAPVYLNFLEKKFSAQIQKRIHLSGEIETLRKLAKNHTLVIVPTHFSNQDSVTIGWAAKALGLPAVLYGAGLNLFGIRMYSFFINRIGAYKIDKRKKNPLYLETLKNYSRYALHRGCHSMFFPYGHRSYSGGIEKNVKLGLLGTAVDAQFLNLVSDDENRKSKKIIIVPVVLNYHFVLEAPFLIDEYLKATGKENYLTAENDRFSNSYDLLKVVYKFFTKDSEFLISFGQGMDVIGNPVDENGKSFDHLGREINISDYFLSHGKLKEDNQRNAEYIKMLGEKIVDSYYRENTVFSSQIVTFVAYELLRKINPKADTYDLMRLPEEDRIISMNEFRKYVELILTAIRNLASQKKLKLDSFLEVELKGNADKIIEHGIKNAGIYHANKVLEVNKEGDVTTTNMKLLFYYHNRLNGYSLEKLF